MAGIKNITSQSVPIGYTSFLGGLNSTSGALGLQNNESSDLRNIDFDKFGSILKRNGYTALNDTAITGEKASDGLWWYEYDKAGTTTRHLINVTNGKLYKMDDLDGTWDDVTGGLTITAASHCDFANFLNEVYITNGTNVPFMWDGGATGAAMTVPTGLTKAKYVVEFNNYLFLANCLVSGTSHKSRIYWSGIKDTTAWDAADFIEVAKNDGQEITGIKVLSDRLVIFKTRSIYNVFFTGDADIPFILPGGGKSNSSVGCVAPWSIQEVSNGLVFFSSDGFYYYDGANSYKLSDRINKTILSLNNTKFANIVSLVQREKDRYIAGVAWTGTATNNRMLVWDYSNNAWSIYDGVAPAAMTTVYVSGENERPYWADFSGFVYRGDIGTDDYPLNVVTAIDAYYYTNWKSFDDIVDQKGIPHITIYYQIANSILTLAYSYNLETADQYSQTFSLSTSSDTYGTGVYGVATYAAEGGGVVRRDLTGRGRVVRYKFANSTLGETFQIDGLGVLPHLETSA